MINSLKKYGRSPYTIVVVHGGPGAGGEMAPVAREIATDYGVLEPIQTALSIEGQIKELKTVIDNNADSPVILIGFSWGAWLSFIFAADYPELIKKLILIGSGPFEEKYAAKIQETRLNRLSEEERTEVESLIEVLDNPMVEDKSSAFERFGALFSKADTYDPIKQEPETINFQADIFQSLWNEAAKLRSSGKLLKLGKHLKCPVTAIHGDYDSHPAEGVQKPLTGILENFRFILLKSCGHKPWIESQARDEFFRILKAELRC